MFYKKPHNVSYTDMAIYIDNNVYLENCDDDKIFEYLYHLSHMLAVKRCLFTSAKNYDDFSLYFATETFMRLRNPDQFGENAKLTKIKSCLNYMKSTINLKKLDYSYKFYSQTFSKNADGTNPEISLDYSFCDRIYDSLDKLDKVEFNVCLNDIAKTTKNFVYSRIHINKDSREARNIYKSCLLTFLNSITFTKNDLKKVNTSNIYNKVTTLEKLYKENELNSCILYDLDESYKDYILVTVRRLKRVIAQDLSVEFKSRIQTDSSLTPLILAELNGDDYVQEFEDN